MRGSREIEECCTKAKTEGSRVGDLLTLKTSAVRWDKIREKASANLYTEPFFKEVST